MLPSVQGLSILGAVSLRRKPGATGGLSASVFAALAGRIEKAWPPAACFTLFEMRARAIALHIESPSSRQQSPYLFDSTPRRKSGLRARERPQTEKD
jgi:hypothetical protein